MNTRWRNDAWRISNGREKRRETVRYTKTLVERFRMLGHAERSVSRCGENVRRKMDRNVK